MARRYGRAPKGQRIRAAVPQNYGPNITVVGAVGWDGVRAAASLDGAVDGAAFRVFVEQVLAPTLAPGDVVVLDNLKPHYVRGVQEAVEERQARLLYLPPYSPDLSPIEPCWSKVKELLRGVGARTREALDRAVEAARARVTPADAQGWFHACGYPVHPP
jgi:transposase